MLQSKAGYIDARPHHLIDEPLATHGRTVHLGQSGRFYLPPATSVSPEQRASLDGLGSSLLWLPSSANRRIADDKNVNGYEPGLPCAAPRSCPAKSALPPHPYAIDATI
ncbi:hypothetical protein Bdiaspc4_24210 [Bradyrhizobium diazoefficiens]|nr:hypothetical protein Bdiaspc4_24210 [Bradyrhizobium diazoefficiens]